MIVYADAFLRACNPSQTFTPFKDGRALFAWESEQLAQDFAGMTAGELRAILAGRKPSPAISADEILGGV